MKIQFDYNCRVVSQSNLEAMCERISGVCHNYYLEELTSTRAGVVYSNPDEWGQDHPMTAYLPVFWRDEVPYIVLDIVDMRGDEFGDGDQFFHPLLDCPELYRVDDQQWVTKEEADTLLVTQRAVRRCGEFSSKGAKI
jgi:hypothetical protein